MVPEDDLNMIVSNIGVTPDLSAIYTTNSAQHTAFVQVSLQEDHSAQLRIHGPRARQAGIDDMPELTTYFQTGGLVDSVVNLGMPAPIDIQVSGNNQHAAYDVATELARQVARPARRERRLIPQDLDYPGLQLERRPRDGRPPGPDSQRRGATTSSPR